jgi:hypothetical protein
MRFRQTTRRLTFSAGDAVFTGFDRCAHGPLYSHAGCIEFARKAGASSLPVRGAALARARSRDEAMDLALGRGKSTTGSMMRPASRTS